MLVNNINKMLVFLFFIITWDGYWYNNCTIGMFFCNKLLAKADPKFFIINIFIIIMSTVIIIMQLNF